MNEKRCKRRRELYAERNQWRCDGRRSTRFAVENAMYMSAYEISESNEVDGIDVQCSENIREEYGEQAGFDEIEMVYGASLKKRLFQMINDVPTIFKVVIGAVKQVKEQAVSQNNSSKNKSGGRIVSVSHKFRPRSLL
ncbi:PHD finger protein Alfin1 [Forsythia ovata]|uniref:PHD finger protein Alfin1 n=1 Tax=Forsythia ovata TaxID=205694 RepID=A0ABD1SQ88_9LAMI